MSRRLPQTAATTPPPARKLGRVPPANVIDTPRFKIVESPNGKTHVVAKLSAHWHPTMRAGPVPPSVDYSAKAAAAVARMYLNDELGCCVVSDVAHQVGVWTGNDGPAPLLATDAEVEAIYRVWNPGGQDNGCVIVDVLDYWVRNGFTLGGTHDRLAAYVAVDWTNPTLLKVAIDLSGTARFGVNLPRGWYDAPEGGLWDVVSVAGAEIVGGHDVGAAGYDARGVQVMTWGGKRTITWAALSAGHPWVSECYAELSEDWWGRDALAPSGVDRDGLLADLRLIGQGDVPDLPDGPPVPPPPPAQTVVGTLTLPQLVNPQKGTWTTRGGVRCPLGITAAAHKGTYQIVMPAKAGPPAPPPDQLDPRAAGFGGNFRAFLLWAAGELRRFGHDALPEIESLAGKLPLTAAEKAALDAVLEMFLGDAAGAG